MFLNTIAWFLLVSLATSGIVPFEDCGSLYNLESVDITECRSYPCHLITGSVYNVITTVVDPKMTAVRNLSNVVYFEVNKIRQSAVVIPDSCLKSDYKMKYRALLTVNALPPLPATIYWALINREGRMMVCYKVTVILSRRSMVEENFRRNRSSTNDTGIIF